MPATEERATCRDAVGSPAWKALESHYKTIRKLHLRKLFADDPTRGERLTVSAAGIELDYSKNRITDETLALLFQLAKDAGLRELAKRIIPELESKDETELTHDSSTNHLIRRYRQLKENA